MTPRAAPHFLAAPAASTLSCRCRPNKPCGKKHKAADQLVPEEMHSLVAPRESAKHLRRLKLNVNVVKRRQQKRKPSNGELQTGKHSSFTR
ncbi:hypothetical protein GGX14DRAFT_562365 [Mycena pura]|uniref:Uncharacterized protein n=1 Tax=Mycena pura TaxID=153505 RepID=A0AAD6VM80_9AGAR|nr:hypothetical protein GGX14DRAFT_562365 [Mycena pura]